MKNLIVILMMSLWAVTGVVLCSMQEAQKPVELTCSSNTPVTIVEPNPELLEYKLEQEELENNNHTLLYIPYEGKEKLYDMPLDVDLQYHIKDVCGEYDVDMELVMAIIKVESQCNADVISDDGLAYGLMQIVPICHKERMQRLEVTDVLNPYQNVEIGIDTLGYLFDTYNDLNYILMCYNMGEGNAQAEWSRGVRETKYTKEILREKDNIAKLKLDDDTQVTDCNQW